MTNIKKTKAVDWKMLRDIAFIIGGLVVFSMSVYNLDTGSGVQGTVSIRAVMEMDYFFASCLATLVFFKGFFKMIRLLVHNYCQKKIEVHIK